MSLDMTHHHQIRRSPFEQLKSGRSELMPQGMSLVDFMRSSLGMDDFEPEANLPWAGHPWVTPILGSGPLGLPADFIEASTLLPGLIRDRLEDHPVLLQYPGIGADPHGWVETYVKELIKQRVGDELDSYVARTGGDGPGYAELDQKVTEEAIQLVLVAGLATRAYYRMCLDGSRPFARWGTERAELSHTQERWQNLQDEYLAPLGNAIVRAKTEVASKSSHAGASHSIWPAIGNLLEQLSVNAHRDDPLISSLQVQQLTECAWQVLVEAVSGHTYPGWTDLLIRLVLSDEFGIAHGHKRPRWFEIGSLSERVRAVVEPAARASWMANDANIEVAENRSLYDSIAEILWAQHAVREWWYLRLGGARKDRAADLPQVTSFGTSFDYELQTALWRTAPDEGAEFSLVVPAYAVERAGAAEADFVWLEGTISVPPRAQRESMLRTEAALQAMRHPTGWRLVASGRKGVAQRRPVVVALAGCPLVDLPTLGEDHPESAELAEDLRRLNLPASSFVHSVTVDEYLALRQTEAEWLWARDEDTSHKENRGLPTTFFETNENAPERYWLALGVPFRDPAVRLRVLGVLARRGDAHSVTDGGDEGEAPREPTHPSTLLGERRGAPTRQRLIGRRAAAVRRLRGLAINARVDDEEIGLLSAIGLSVVRDRCENFSEDLSGYAGWLSASLQDVRECGSDHD